MDDSPSFRWIELAEVDSTNNFLLHYRPPVEVPLVLVTAEHQWAGRGSGANRWESEAGKNLLFSLRWLPQRVEARRIFGLSEVLALALCDALTDYAPGFQVKWPNDVYHGDWKVAGTLIENELQGKHVACSVMGTGINVNQTAFVSDAPNPRSLAQILGHEVERREVLQGVMYHFARYRRMLEDGESDALHALYKTRLYRWQQAHTFEDATGRFRARITDVEPDGHLVLTDTTGRVRRYAFKEVSYVIGDEAQHHD